VVLHQPVDLMVLQEEEMVVEEEVHHLPVDHTVHQEVDLEDLVVVLNLTMVVVHLQLVVIMVRHLVVLEGVEVEPPLLVDHMEHREEAILLVTEEEEVEEDVNQEEERQHLLTGNLSEISPDGLHLLIEFEPLIRIKNSRNILSFEMCSVMLQLLVKTVLV